MMMTAHTAAESFVRSLACPTRKHDCQRLEVLIGVFVEAAFRMAIERARAEYVLRHGRGEPSAFAKAHSADDSFLAAMNRLAKESLE